jgi:hypothetical protein
MAVRSVTASHLDFPRAVTVAAFDLAHAFAFLALCAVDLARALAIVAFVLPGTLAVFALSHG